jgi:hypothetical protein
VAFITAFRYLSSWQRCSRWWVSRGPHVEWPGLVTFIDAATGVSHDAPLRQGDRPRKGQVMRTKKHLEAKIKLC